MITGRCEKSWFMAQRSSERELETWQAVVRDAELAQMPSPWPTLTATIRPPQLLSPAGPIILALQPSLSHPSQTMADTSKPPSEGSFEFIETPPAHTPPPAENYGVRTTNVSFSSPKRPRSEPLAVQIPSPADFCRASTVPDHQECSSTR